MDRWFKALFENMDRILEEAGTRIERTASSPAQREPVQAPLIPGTAKQRSASKKIETAWIGPDETVTIHGLEISCGLFYLGETLRPTYGKAEPVEINPKLQVNFHPKTPASNPGYYARASYAELTPAVRGNYLRWMAAGRSPVGAPRIFFDLFVAGIERRLTTDLLLDPSLRGELPAVRLELERLGTTYQSHHYGVHERIKNMIDLVDALAYEVTGELPTQLALEDTQSVPLCLYLLLADKARRKEAIMGPLALAWAWYHPRVPRRSMVNRHPMEFARLFLLRFEQTYPNGITVKVGKRVAKLMYSKQGEYYYYHEPVYIRDVPNIFANTGQLRKIAWVFSQAENELSPFSRAMANARTDAEKLAAIGSLPRELIDGFSKQTDRLRTSVEKLIGTETRATVPGGELIALWPITTPGRITAPQAKSLLRVLGVLGFGIEPDLRFDGPLFTAETELALFRQGSDAPDIADRAYSAARIVAVLSAMGAQADGPVGAASIDLITRSVSAAFGLDPDLAERLDAHLRWISSKPIKINGLASRAQATGIAHDERYGELICAMATVDGGITPAKMKLLGKAYSALDLDPALVSTHLHLALTRGSSPPARSDKGLERSTVTLDRGIINHKIEQSRQISAILTDLFTDEEPEPTAPVSNEPVISSLDAAHSRLLRALGTQESWSRAELDRLAAEHRLLPDGAIDTLNEAALDLFGEPLFDGDDPLAVNPDALEQLMG